MCLHDNTTCHHHKQHESNTCTVYPEFITTRSLGHFPYTLLEQYYAYPRNYWQYGWDDEQIAQDFKVIWLRSSYKHGYSYNCTNTRGKKNPVGKAWESNPIELLCRQSFTSEVSDHSTQAVHAWHVATRRFVTLLSTKVVNREILVTVAEKSLSWNRVICPTRMQLLWLLYTSVKSEHSLACKVLTWGILENTPEGSRLFFLGVVHA